MRVLALICLVGCGAAVPNLPTEVPASATRPVDADAGRLSLADRGVARSRLACLDCHHDDFLRFAPPLGDLAGRERWWGGDAATLPEAVTRCAERYQLRSPSADHVADLVAALQAWPPPRESEPPTTPAEAYDRACAVCHEAGPADPLLGRRWSLEHLRRTVFGPRPPDPARLMPTFPAGDQAALEPVLQWLAAGAGATLTPP